MDPWSSPEGTNPWPSSSSHPRSAGREDGRPPRSVSQEKMRISFLLNSEEAEPLAMVHRPDSLLLPSGKQAFPVSPLAHQQQQQHYRQPSQPQASHQQLSPIGPAISSPYLAEPAYKPTLEPVSRILYPASSCAYGAMPAISLAGPSAAADTIHQIGSVGESSNSDKSLPSEHSLRNQSNKHFWTQQEDDMLIKLVEKHGPKNWDRMAALHLSHRNGSQLRARWLYNLSKMQAGSSHEFTQEEDKFILAFYEKHGGSWSRMAKELGGGRNDQEVKNRFRKLERIVRAQRANESLEFTSQEDAFILDFVAKNGSRWTELSKLLHDRTPDEVKNRYRKLERRRKAAENNEKSSK